jgi:ribosomal protein S18 acetylase RimI-like enzyme
MKKLTIINTTYEDLPTIYQLYDMAIAYQRIKGYPVWNGYDKRILDEEIENRSQYKILLNAEIACIFSACQPGSVEAELWKERASVKSLYLHRIVVNQQYKGQKLFASILEWAENHMEGNDYKYVRMDTWADNPSLINYYKSFGFEEAGIGFTSDSPDLPSQYRNVKIIMMEKSTTS